MSDYPFKLKIHKLKNEALVAEIQAEGVIDISHKLIEVINTFLSRYAFVIINLGNSAALSYNIEKTFNHLQNKDKLIVIAEKDKQLGFYIDGIMRFSNIDTALKVIDGNFGVVQVIHKVSELPMLNQSVFRVLKILCDPMVTFDRLETILKNEDKIAKELIECANTMKTEADGDRVYSDVKSILSYQGLEGVRLLLLEDAFKMFEQIFKHQSSDKLYHMRYCMGLTGKVAILLGIDKRSVRKMRLAGLYHDLGSLLIRHIFAAQYSKVNELVAEGKDIVAAEEEVLRISHQEVGEMMGYALGLPDYIVSSISHHHKEKFNPEDIYLSVTMVCNGFLNAEIEKRDKFTPYDDRIEFLNGEYKKLIADKSNENAKRTIADLEAVGSQGTNSPFEKERLHMELQNEYMILSRALGRR